MKRILLSSAVLLTAASGPLHAADAFYICSGNDNAPLRRNGDGDRGISCEILNNASYTQPSGIGIDTVGKKAYYWNGTTTICRTNLAGTLLETIYAPGFGYPEALTIDPDNDRLYFLHKDIPFSVSRKFYRVKRESPID